MAPSWASRLEPGRAVVEVRASGATRARPSSGCGRPGPGGGLFVGDDLGDVAGFEAVERFRDAGGPGLLVCSGSEEERELVRAPTSWSPGPQGVVALLAALAVGPGSG